MCEELAIKWLPKSETAASSRTAATFKKYAGTILVRCVRFCIGYEIYKRILGERMSF